MSPNKKVTKEVGQGEGLSSLLPQSKPPLPLNPTCAHLRWCSIGFLLPIGFRQRKTVDLKYMETGVRIVYKMWLWIWLGAEVPVTVRPSDRRMV